MAPPAYFFPRFASRKRTCFRTASPSAVALAHTPCLVSRSAVSRGLHRLHSPPLNPTLCDLAVERTNRVVFQHTQRLVHARSLHRAVVPCHGHGDEAHHDGAGLCCAAPLAVAFNLGKKKTRYLSSPCFRVCCEAVRWGARRGEALRRDRGGEVWRTSLVMGLAREGPIREERGRGRLGFGDDVDVGLSAVIAFSNGSRCVGRRERR